MGIGEADPSTGITSSQNQPSNPQTQTGIDVLESTHYAALAEATHRHNNSLELGLLTNQTGLDSKGTRGAFAALQTVMAARVLAMENKVTDYSTRLALVESATGAPAAVSAYRAWPDPDPKLDGKRLDALGSALAQPGGTLDAACQTVTQMLREHGEDDITLMLARIRQ